MIPFSCFQYDKDSKMKANHNIDILFLIIIFVVSSTTKLIIIFVVSSTTKIVKWKQITTATIGYSAVQELFPVRQR